MKAIVDLLILLRRAAPLLLLRRLRAVVRGARGRHGDGDRPAGQGHAVERRDGRAILPSWPSSKPAPGSSSPPARRSSRSISMPATSTCSRGRRRSSSGRQPRRSRRREAGKAQPVARQGRQGRPHQAGRRDAGGHRDAQRASRRADPAPHPQQVPHARPLARSFAGRRRSPARNTSSSSRTRPGVSCSNRRSTRPRCGFLPACRSWRASPTRGRSRPACPTAGSIRAPRNSPSPAPSCAPRRNPCGPRHQRRCRRGSRMRRG